MQKFTLLLDLDDTLLDTNMHAFIPAYFSTLSTAMKDIVAPEVMLPALTGGTKAMMQNDDPGITLRQAFDAHFYPEIGIDRQTLQARIDRYYEVEFPSLSSVVSQRPEAIHFVRWAFEKGFRLAVATNPFFPLRAVHHRMRWAGLAPEDHQFDLVSSYESFHFTKDHPSYFLECLGQMGWPDDPVVMVGNDLEMDLIPAQRAGLTVFWLKSEPDVQHNGIPSGTFDNLMSWLEHSDPEKMSVNFKEPESILAMLMSTPAVVDSLVKDLPRQSWECHPEEGEWCLTEIFCHLRDVEQEIYIPRIEKILQESNPFLPGVDSDDWVKTKAYSSQDGEKAKSSFIEARKKTLSMIRRSDLPWDAPARHAIFGSTTLREILEILAGHDRAHVQQIWKTIRS